MIQALAVRDHSQFPLVFDLNETLPGLGSVACVAMPRSRIFYTLSVVFWWIDIATIELDLVIGVKILVRIQVILVQVILFRS